MKITCYLAEDLMPAYMEHLTGEETERDIREHLETCKACRELYEEMGQNLAIPAAVKEGEERKEENSHGKELLYLGKIRRTYDLRAVLSILGFVGITGLLLLIAWNHFYNISDSLLLSYVMLPVVILFGGFECYRNFGMEKEIKKDLWIGQAVLFLAAAAAIAVLFLATVWVKRGVYPFGLEASRLGPYVAGVFYAGIIAAIAAFFWSVYRILQTSFAYFFLAAHAVSLLYAEIGFYQILKRLTDLGEFFQLCVQAAGIYFMGIVVTGIVWLFVKRVRKVRA